MRRCRTVIVIALLGSVPVIAAVLVMRLVLPIGQSQAGVPAQQAAPVVEEKAELVLVLAAAQFLPVGTLLADEHLTEVGIEEHLVVRGHIEVEGLDPDEMPYGHAVREAIEAGALLTRHSLVGPRQKGFLATVLKPGMRAVTVGAATGHTRPFNPGDRVDVVLTARSRERGEQRVLVRKFLENVRVVAVDRGNGGAADVASPGDEVERKVIVTATLEVLPSQTGLVALAGLEGELSLAVRPPAAAGGPDEALGMVDMQGLPALPPESLQQQIVRVVRGRAVSDAVFGDDLQAASRRESVLEQNGLEAGPEVEPLHTLASARSDRDGDGEKRAGGGASRAGKGEPGSAAQSVFSPPAAAAPQQSEHPVAPDIERQHALTAADAGLGSVLLQRLAGGIAPVGAADTASETESPSELAAASLPEPMTVESDLAAGPTLEPMPEFDSARPDLDTVPGEPVGAGAATAGETGPETTKASAFSSVSDGALDEHALPLALDVNRPGTLPAAAPAVGDATLLERTPGAPLAGGIASAGSTQMAVGLATDMLRQDVPAESRPGALPTLEPLDTRTADRGGREAVEDEPIRHEAAPAGKVEPTVAEQAVQSAVASLPWNLLSENRMLVVGGPIMLLGLSGAFLWLRRQNKALRARLQAVGAPLTGHGAVEQIAPEESIFRQTRPHSRLSWLWRRIERRYPLIDAPKAFPRLLGVSVLVAAGVWAGTWVLGMAGWWSLPAAALAGFAGAWFALRRIQARAETRFIQQFPEIVDQIVRLSGAGLPPLEALGKVAEDAQQPVKGVLEEVSDALLAGLDADTALGMVAGRVRLAEFTLFAAVIRLQRRAGGSISGAFSNLANTLRERRTTALKAKASTAQTRLTLLVLMLMPPLVLGVQSMTSPQSVDLLFNSEDGKTLLQLGVGLIVVGLVVARQIAARGPR